jgi:hypothetical protein
VHNLRRIGHEEVAQRRSSRNLLRMSWARNAIGSEHLLIWEMLLAAVALECPATIRFSNRHFEAAR